jgi:hypothetical protein
MMRLYFPLILAFSANSLLAQGTKTLSKPTYSIKYPDTWTVADGSTNTSFTISAPSDGAEDKFTEFIDMIANTISSYTPKTYAAYSKTYLPTKIKNFKVLEEKEVKQGGKTGYYMIFNGKQDNLQRKWKQYYFIEKGKVFIVTFVAEEKKFADYMKKIGSTLSSFTVK